MDLRGRVIVILKRRLVPVGLVSVSRLSGRFGSRVGRGFRFGDGHAFRLLWRLLVVGGLSLGRGR